MGGARGRGAEGADVVREFEFGFDDEGEFEFGFDDEGEDEFGLEFEGEDEDEGERDVAGWGVGLL